MMKNRGITKKRQPGFTIVELLIVIVVIAILAAISIVAYNGVQQRAKSAALADATVKVQKAFKLWSIQDGFSTWPVYANNPKISVMISSTEMKNYLQKTPQLSGNVDSDWEYDNDGDSRSGCDAYTAGANVFINNVDQAIAQQVDEKLDDGLLNCGVIRYTGTYFWITIGETQAVK